MIAALLALLLGGSSLLAQQPTRDAATQAASAAARVSGIVVTADRDAQPVRRAIVTLSGTDGGRSTITDESGRFAFADLPAGRFTVSAARRGYLTTAFGARHPGEAGTPIHLAENTHASDIRIVLPKGAVLTGTITDPNGLPLPSLPVTVFKVTPTYAPAGTAVTDDRGEYRVFGLMPGTYVVTAVPRTAGAGDMAVRTEREVDALLRSLERRGSGGATAARPGASETPAPLDATPPRVSSFAPFYYPGTPVSSEAGRITVMAGEVRGGLDFTAGLAATASVAGVVTSADGRPAANVQLTMLSNGPSLPLIFSVNATGIMRTAADGSFAFASVTPGSYRITARSSPPSSSAPRSPGAVPGSGLPIEVAVADVTVNGEDITGLAMTLQAGLRLSGKVIFEGTSKIPVNLDQLRVVLQPFPVPARGSGAAPTPLKADGTFAVQNLLPGSYTVELTTPKAVNETWWVRSAMVRGQDVLDVPLELAAGAGPSELVFTLSDRRPSLSGVVRADAAAGVSESVVIAFSTDPAHWRAHTRRVRAVRPDTSGRYEITDVAPGEYFVVAVREAAPDAWHDAAFLEQLVARAVRTTVGDGERKTADLRR